MMPPETTGSAHRRRMAGSTRSQAGLVSSRLIPTASGTTNGHAASKSPRTAPGSAHAGSTFGG